MNAAHFSDDELLAYLLDRNDEAARSHIEADACNDCSRRLAGLRDFTELLFDKDVQTYATRAGSGQPLTDDVRHARQLAKDRGEDDRLAKETFESLQAAPAETWLSHLPVSVWSAGLVRILIRGARAEFDRLPKRALHLLDLAEEIASRLGSELDVTEQRGTVAKTRAEALRMLGRPGAALEALDVAQGLLSKLPAPAYDLAFVDWVRAGVLFSMSRYAEALDVARRAIRVFCEHGDVDNAERVRMIEATILCEQGHVAPAHAMFTRLVLFFERRDDPEMVARISANLAECEVRLDRTDVAYEYADDAMRMYDALGYATEKVRVRWILGHALMRAGNAHEALQELRAAADDFQRLGMTADVAVV